MKKYVLILAALVLFTLATGIVIAQDGGDCTACHNDTTIITGKVAGWELSGHGTGTSWDYAGGRGGCAACHSGGVFSEMAAAGMNPGEVEAGDPNPTRQDCRACHNIHTTYTADDWSLETIEPVELYAFEGVTYDGGAGNLCATCHQPRRQMVAEDGIVNWSSSHYGPHHGPQSAMLLGVGGAGVEGDESIHARFVDDTCVTCHVANDDHSFEASLAVCQECHDEAEDFDIGGVQTQVDELVAELQELLVAKGMLAGDEEHGFHSVVGEYPEAEAAALWNYIFIVPEDGSHGVHNPDYTIALLESSIAALK